MKFQNFENSVLKNMSITEQLKNMKNENQLLKENNSDLSSSKKLTDKSNEILLKNEIKIKVKLN
jgi:hypothetical protein